MENKESSEFLDRVSAIIKELHELINGSTDKSFIVMARDAKYDNSIHMIATAGSRAELAKNAFGLLVLSKEQEFVRDAMKVFNHLEECTESAKALRLQHSDKTFS